MRTCSTASWASFTCRTPTSPTLPAARASSSACSTVVSYTTTIGACNKKGAQNATAAAASMWLEWMRLRGVGPNYHIYNTALVGCLVDTVESTYGGANIATDILEDAKTEIAYNLNGSYDFYSTLLDSYTKVLTLKLMK